MEWECSAVSDAWVVRVEALVCILDVEQCTLDASPSIMTMLQVLIFLNKGFVGMDVFFLDQADSFVGIDRGL